MGPRSWREGVEPQRGEGGGCWGCWALGCASCCPSARVAWMRMVHFGSQVPHLRGSDSTWWPWDRILCPHRNQNLCRFPEPAILSSLPPSDSSHTQWGRRGVGGVCTPRRIPVEVKVLALSETSRTQHFFHCQLLSLRKGLFWATSDRNATQASL